ncbi:EAL domain-containing protein [Thalassotalea piscium]
MTKTIYHQTNLNLITLFFVVLLFGLAYVGIQQQADRLKTQELNQLAIISEQLSSRVDIFSASRIRALQDIANNWPDHHPNMELWFNISSSRIMNILPAIDQLIWVDKSRDRPWQVPANGVIDKQILAFDFDRINETGYPFISNIFDTDNKQQIVAIILPVSSDHQIKGWLICTIDFPTAFKSMVGKNSYDSLHFKLLDGDRLIASSTPDTYRGNQLTKTLDFGTHQFTLQLFTGKSTFNQSAYLIFSFIIVALFGWVSRLLIANHFKVILSQQRFKAASESALDAMLIFYQFDTELVLQELNPNATTILGVRDKDINQMTYTDFIQAIGLESEWLVNAPERVFQGAIIDQMFEVDLVNKEIHYIKLQMVRAQQYIAITIRDVTARINAEHSLVKREQKYRRLVEGLSGHFLYSLNTDGELDYVSSSVKNIIGYKAEDVIKQLNGCMLREKVKNCQRGNRADVNHAQKFNVYTIELLNKKKELKVLELTESTIVNENNQLIALEGIAKDVTREKQLADELLFQAKHDALTGLFNRYAFDDKLSEIITEGNQGDEEHLGCVCYLDLDQFKVVNDTSGHIAGDELLNQLGLIISNELAEHTVARLGGDEFGVLFKRLNVKECMTLLTQLQVKINEFRFFFEDKIFRVSASMGLSVINQGMNSAELMKAADVACYMAKDSGRNRISVYNINDEETNYHSDKLTWANEIQSALDQNRFKLFHQTIKPIHNDNNTGKNYEILLRMIDLKGELISPALFIPAAERYNLMGDIDRWVLTHVIKRLHDNPVLLEETQKCSINLSGATIIEESFADEIIHWLNENNIPPNKICFEITETEAVTKLNKARQFIKKLRDVGCEFALDDFGVGMCSFAYLKHLPVDNIKIDGSFVKNLCHDESDQAIVKSINDIAKSLGKKTIAEFVGDEATEKLLKSMSVDYLQGYFIDQPREF